MTPRIRAILVAFAPLPFILAALAASVSISVPPGSDWFWYRNGADRLLAGGPLYDPRMVAGAYDQISAAFQFHWNQVPFLAPVIIPFTIIPEPYARFFWLILTSAAIPVALYLIRPRGISRATLLILATWVVVTPAVIEGFAWGNISGLAALGCALIWRGDRDGDRRLIFAGLLLCAPKVFPAVTLGLWLLAWRRRAALAPILGALIACLVLMIPVLVAVGPGVITDFLSVTAHAAQVIVRSNAAPSLYLRPYLGPDIAIALSNIAGLALLVATLVFARRIGPSGSFLLCIGAAALLVPNLWNHWLLIPYVGIAVALDGSRTMRWLDGLLRPLGESRSSPGSGRIVAARPSNLHDFWR
jgi:hypothetical protein